MIQRLLVWLEALPTKLGIATPDSTHVFAWPIWKRLLFTNRDPKNVYAVALLSWVVREYTHLPAWGFWIPAIGLVTWAWVKLVEHNPLGFEWEDVADAALGLLLAKGLVGGPWL